MTCDREVDIRECDTGRRWNRGKRSFVHLQRNSKDRAVSTVSVCGDVKLVLAEDAVASAFTEAEPVGEVASSLGHLASAPLSALARQPVGA